MKIMKQCLILVVTVCVLMACTPPVHERDLYVFGTVVNVKLTGVSDAKAKQLFDALGHQAQGMHQRWHAWQGKELADIAKACKTGEPVVLTDDIRYLLAEGQRLERLSQGNFNPAIGQLIDAWGFLSDDSTALREKPDEQKLAQIRAAHPSMADITIQGKVLHCHNPSVRIDMGAYAKGYALSLFMDYLRVQGVDSALISIGGDILTLGSKGSKSWRVAIRSPKEPKPMAEVLSPDNESIFTSGTYERAFKNAKGEIFHHVIDPKTGYPCDHFISATVIDADPIVADAAATALLVSDEQTWPSIAKGMGIKQVLLVDKYGKVWVSKDMQARIIWLEDIPVNIVGL